MRSGDTTQAAPTDVASVAAGATALVVLAVAAVLGQAMGWDAEASAAYVPATEPRVLFASMDLDRSGALELREARAFFAWTEQNVRLRHDDENARDIPRGVIVGDGRKGWNYQQTPEETLAERAGDCEDLAAFEAALFAYWGVTSFVAYVSSDRDATVDHALAVVRLDELDPDGDASRKLDRYRLQETNPFGVPPGDHVPVDNALATKFGQQPGDLKDGRFHIIRLATIDAVLRDRA